MGDVIHTIANPLGTIGNWVGVNTNSQLGKNLHYLDSTTHPIEQTASDMYSADKPAAPGINKNLSNVQNTQVQKAQNFRKGLLGTENSLGHNLAEENNHMLGQNLQGIRQNNSHRGLLYGGLNYGQEQGARVGAARSLAQGRTSINNNMENAANTMDQQAIHTGVGIQQSQQQIQDAIYGQALADMQAKNAALGGFISGAGKIGGAFAGGA